MEVQVKVAPQVIITASADTTADTFRQLAEMQEIFGQACQCEKCKGTNLRFVVRTVDSNDFFELRCQNPKCRAVLSFGQSREKKGQLFPHKKENDKKSIMDGALEPGAYLPDGGWLRYNSETKKKF